MRFPFVAAASAAAGYEDGDGGDAVFVFGQVLDNHNWRQGWGSLLPSLDALVAFGEPDGIIGRGTFVEIVDAVGAGCEVWIAEQPRRWWPPTLVDAPRCPGGSPRWYAQLIYPTTPFTPRGHIG